MKTSLLAILLFVACNGFAATSQADPFSDNILTCKEMQAYPKKIFRGGIDLGSGHGSPIQVDYDCQGGLASLPFLTRIHGLAETIRSDEGPPFCTGSIIHAHWRYYHFSLLMAGLAPDLSLESDEEPQQPDKFLSYFEFWASQSPSNYRLYTVFLAESRKVHPLLARHYQQRFRYPRNKANIVATQALALFADRAAGSFPGSSPYSSEDPKRLSDLAKLTKSGNPDSATLKAILATNPPEEEIDQALKTALLTNKPKSVIHLLADSLKSMDHGDESALFFALPDLENVKLLLTKGASINYANGFGKTPLFYAVEKNQHALAEFLIRHGANPNHAYKSADELMENECAYNIVHSRRTPLMHAAQHADVEMLKLLIRHGARLQDVDDQGFNALDYAMKNQQTSNIKFLRSLGVRPNLALDAAPTPTSGE